MVRKQKVGHKVPVRDAGKPTKGSVADGKTADSQPDATRELARKAFDRVTDIRERRARDPSKGAPVRQPPTHHNAGRRKS